MTTIMIMTMIGKKDFCDSLLFTNCFSLTDEIDDNNDENYGELRPRRTLTEKFSAILCRSVNSWT